MKISQQEYLLVRAKVEHQAAERATCTEAALAHKRLADLYFYRLSLPNHSDLLPRDWRESELMAHLGQHDPDDWVDEMVDMDD